MRRSWIAFVVIFAAGVPLYAAKNQEKAKSFVQGQVINVQRHRKQFPDYSTAGSNPSDAPLASRYYSYDIAVRVNCETYVARYDSPFNALPLPLSSNQPVQVMVSKHVLHFDFPDDPDVRMAIVRRANNCGADCGRHP